jgi:hypothetical protein
VRAIGLLREFCTGGAGFDLAVGIDAFRTYQAYERRGLITGFNLAVELGQHGRYRTNVWEYRGVNTLKAGRLDELALHPTVKPVTMIADAIKDVSYRNGIVLDLFGGSGSTLIAAHKTGRRARLCELDPVYCDRILQRWEVFAKDDAELIACGRFGGPANDVVVDEQTVEKQTFQEKNKEILTAPKRKLRAKAGNGDLKTRADPMLGGSSFGSRRPRRASC